MVAMDLESIIREVMSVEIVVAASVSGAPRAMAAPLDFAFLNVEVTDGKTYEIALELQGNEVPFVFVLGSRSETLPPDLRSALFIPKPFSRRQIERILL